MAIPTVSPPPSSGLLRIFANASIAYPLVLIGLFYAEWYLAWHMLGHEPQWSTDDPKSIDGSSWLHLINWLLLLGMLPACLASTGVNAAYILLRRPSAAQAGVRIMTVVAFWLGLFVWLVNSRSTKIVEWWFD